MGSDTVRLIIWGSFGFFGFLVFLLILKLLSRVDKAKASGGIDKPENLKKMRNPIALVTERSAAVVPTVLRHFSLAKLQEATDHFNALNLIKIGLSGDFFAGILDGEERIVVKRMKTSAADELQIHAGECGERHDVVLVPVLGYCSEGEESQSQSHHKLNFLVYKFLGNGDLATALAKGRRVLEDNVMGSLSLPWITRLKIATETARALFHLHYRCSPPLLHKDIKSSSILLSEEFEVRLGSLSCMQKVESEALLSYDVFCFGRVLLDLISGLDVSGCQDPYAEAWLKKALVSIDSGYPDNFLALIDPFLVVEEDFTREILGVAALARACLDPNSVKHMNMRTVCQALQNPHHYAND